MNTPMISVIMPVYNAEKYLKEAIDSILTQTFSDFEFIILNDGSTDNSEKIILSYNDLRIRYVKNVRNLKIVKTLNKGIELAQGKYIARMDADDICFSERFEKQIKFMERNLDIGVCGTWLKTFYERDKIWEMPVTHDEIIMEMLFHSSIMHPTVLIRKKLLNSQEKIYNESFNGVEDYDLWIRLSKNTKFANIPEVLLNYRMNDLSNARKEYKNKQVVLSNILRAQQLQYNYITFEQHEIDLHNDLATYVYSHTNEFVVSAKNWLIKIMLYNKKFKFVSDKVCKRNLINNYFHICSTLKKEVDTYSNFVDFLKQSKTTCYRLRIKLLILTKIYCLKRLYTHDL